MSKEDPIPIIERVEKVVGWKCPGCCEQLLEEKIDDIVFLICPICEATWPKRLYEVEFAKAGYNGPKKNDVDMASLDARDYHGLNDSMGGGTD